MLYIEAYDRIKYITFPYGFGSDNDTLELPAHIPQKFIAKYWNG